MLKIVIGTNEGKVLCISNNEDEIKASMVNYLIDTDQEPTEDFFESQNWGEYDIEVYEYHQPQLNENQQVVLEWLKKSYTSDDYTSPMLAIYKLYSSQQMATATVRLTKEQQYQVLATFAEWGSNQ